MSGGIERNRDDFWSIVDQVDSVNETEVANVAHHPLVKAMAYCLINYPGEEKMVLEDCLSAFEDLVTDLGVSRGRSSEVFKICMEDLPRTEQLHGY
jgi:hypothetical protein